MGAVISCLASSPLHAQASPMPGARPTRDADDAAAAWKTRKTLEVVSEYDDNVFLLPESRKPDLDSPSSGELASGRYADMRGPGDVITTVKASIALRRRGLFGRDLEIRPEIAFDAYTRNAERRNLGIGLSLEQRLPHGSRARLVARMAPTYFARNYLTDAVDADLNGTISSAERIYLPGKYREGEVLADYRVRLDKSTKKRPFGAALQAGGGYYARSYDAPFAGRDLSGPTAHVALLTSLTRRVDVDLKWEFADLSATPASTVMVVDEPVAGSDLNGNGNATDSNVRTIGLADRSRSQHTIGARLHIDLGHRRALRFEAERRSRSYASRESTDYTYNGRRDARTSLGAELTIGLTDRVSLLTRAETASQTLDRGNDAGLGDIDDYTRHRFALGLRFGL